MAATQNSASAGLSKSTNVANGPGGASAINGSAPASPPLTVGSETIGSGRPPRSKSGNDLVSSATGLSGMTTVVDSPVSGSPPGTASSTNAAAGVRESARSRTDFSSSPNGSNGAGPKSLPATRRHSGDHNGAPSSNPSAPHPGGSVASGMPPVASGPKGEDSLSSHLERLRLNAQAAKNGAQNGGVGAIGFRDGRGPASGSRFAKASLPTAPGNAALAGVHPATGLARDGSNTGSAAGANDAQMSTFLFDDELDAELHNSTYGGRYLQMNADDDKFPVLIRRDSYPGILSASSAALDLAPLSQTPPRNTFLRGEASRTSEWPQFADQTSTNTASTTGAVLASATTVGGLSIPGGSPQSKIANNSNPPVTSAGSITHRLSGDFASAVNGASTARSRNVLDAAASPRSRQLPPPRAATVATSTSTASSGTVPGGVPTTATMAVGVNLPSERSSPPLEGSGSPKKLPTGPIAGSTPVNGAPASPEELKRKAQLMRERERLERASMANNASNQLEGHKFSDGTPSPAAMYAGELAALNGTFSPYPLDRSFNAGPYSAGGDAYGPFGGRRAGPGTPQQQQQPKRDEPNRFAGLRLEDLQGDMAALCKDQHGCRFLQKKLEESNPEHRDMIFQEIYPHFGDLMTDSFGNYLSQKLLEHSTDDQRDALLESISGELVTISLNMHGTRAVQKMIDYLSTQRQVQSLIMALNLNVVTLIKDLNGNHVIQKCLNTLPPEDNQFIYNAVAANCIEVATHRHGCCVLQRCIDHASESQRIQLVTEITYNSLTLVLDPFGNYVVQYVLDLNDSRFISAIVNQFRNNVCALSAQKFSSNVVEKCIRVADLEGRKALISELIDRSRLERMLRDSFANYVVQTALDYAEPNQRAELVGIIRPVLPMIRNTPYGKRIQSKIQREGFHDAYGRGGGGGGGFHPGMYGGMGGMGGMSPAGYYGVPYGGPPHGGPNMGHPYPHHGLPQHGHNPYGPANEAHMSRGPGPYGHYPQHMPPHMASPAMSQPFSPSFGPSTVPMDYPQAPNYPYL